MRPLLTVIALLLPISASAGPFLLIWGGGTTPEEGARALAELSKAPWTDVLEAGSGYPRVEASSKVAGLNPGFFVAVIGACGDKVQAEARLAALRGVVPIAQAPAAYVREVADGRAPSCPTVRPPPPCADPATCERSCDEGQAAACDHLAGQVAAEPGRAGALHLKGCVLESAWACAQAAEDARLGRGVGQDSLRAAELALRACQLGDGESCEAGAGR
jgi:hypothetical protein